MERKPRIYYSNTQKALTDLAAGGGLDWARVAMYLDSTTDVQTVDRLEQQVRNAGVDTVPFFIFNNKVTVAGAHETKVPIEAMEMATAPEAAPIAG